MSTSAVRIEDFLWFMQGATHPVMVQASDGHHYILKLAADSGSALAFNESAGTELLAACGLSVATWAPLELSQNLIDLARKRWPELTGHLSMLEPGLYFGSRYLGLPGTRLFRSLPAEGLFRIRNRTAFWLAWLIDVCAEQTSHRQVIFIENPNKQIDAYFTDQSGLFCGVNHDQHSEINSAKHADERIYVHLRPSELASIPLTIAGVDLDHLRRKVLSLPAAWRSPSSMSIFENCLQRLANQSLLNQIMHSIDHAHRMSPRILFGLHNDSTETMMSQAH